MKHVFLFLRENKGTSQKSGKPYHMVELHNPETLTNGTFGVKDGLDLTVFKNRQKVECDLELSSEGFDHRIAILAIKAAV